MDPSNLRLLVLIPLTLNRADQYNQQGVVEMTTCNFQDWFLEATAASSLLSSIACSGESYCHSIRILKPSSGESMWHGTETSCPKAAQLCHLYVRAILETDHPDLTKLKMPAALVDTFTAISLVLSQNHPVKPYPDT